MASSYAKLDQALKDLIEAYTELDEELEEKYGDDEDSFSHAMIEALETSIESAIEEYDTSTSSFATVLSSLTEALEQLDPSAFDEDESEYELEDVDVGVDDVEDEDVEDYDLDEEDDADLDDEEEEEEDE